MTFPRVAADLRSDLFRHLAGHGPRYFADRLPGTLTSRITAASNAVVSLENMFAWNVLPPIVGNIGAIVVLASVSLPVTAGLMLVALAMVLAIYRLAAAARPLHRVFAEKAAAVDGELVDIIGNMADRARLRRHAARDAPGRRARWPARPTTRRQSLLYMDRLRMLHSTMVVIVMVALLGWAIVLWQRRLGDHRRCRSRLHARIFHSPGDPRTGLCLRRCDPAHGALGRGDRRAAAAAGNPRPAGG